MYQARYRAFCESTRPAQIDTAMNDSLPPELAAIEDLLRRAAHDEAPPPRVLARVLALDNPSARLKQSGAALLRRLVAVVAAEGSSLGFSPAWGVRGATLAEGQWLFRAEDVEIDLRAVRKGESWAFAGQLFGMPDAERVVLEGPVPSATVVLGPTQEFAFGSLVAGSYRLTVQGGDVEVVIPRVDIGASGSV